MNKIIFSDVDGTLVDHNFIIDDKINNKLNSMDIDFVVATGRMYMTAKDLNVNDNTDFICSNGGEVIIDNQTISINTMDKDMSIKLINSLIKDKKYLNIYTTSGCYVPIFDGINDIIINEANRYAKEVSNDILEYKKNISGHLDLFYFDNEITSDINKILNEDDIIKIEIVDCFDINLAIKDITSRYEVSAFNSFGNNLEIVSVGVNKVLGIKNYLKYKQKTNYITFAIGDGNNDLEMFEYADVSIAMGNASDLVKSKADYIVSKQNENGYLDALDIINNYKKGSIRN